MKQKMDHKEKLKKIREKRKKSNKENEKPQKRSVEIIEYEDGTFLLSNNPLWSLPLKRKEVIEAVGDWLDGSLEGTPVNISPIDFLKE